MREVVHCDESSIAESVFFVDELEYSDEISFMNVFKEDFVEHTKILFSRPRPF